MEVFSAYDHRKRRLWSKNSRLSFALVLILIVLPFLLWFTVREGHSVSPFSSREDRTIYLSATIPRAPGIGHQLASANIPFLVAEELRQRIRIANRVLPTWVVVKICPLITDKVGAARFESIFGDAAHRPDISWTSNRDSSVCSTLPIVNVPCNTYGADPELSKWRGPEKEALWIWNDFSTRVMTNSSVAYSFCKEMPFIQSMDHCRFRTALQNVISIKHDGISVVMHDRQRDSNLPLFTDSKGMPTRSLPIEYFRNVLVSVLKSLTSSSARGVAPSDISIHVISDVEDENYHGELVESVSDLFPGVTWVLDTPGGADRSSSRDGARFLTMASADVLIGSRSGFSFFAGLANDEGVKLFHSFFHNVDCHESRGAWILVDEAEAWKGKVMGLVDRYRLQKAAHELLRYRKGETGI